MRFLIGLLLILLGLYLLGKNIMFTTHILPRFWQDVSATGSVLCIAAGVAMLIFADGNLEKGGWIFLFIGILLVFVNARVFIKPTSLWTFFGGFASMLAGFKVMQNRID